MRTMQAAELAGMQGTAEGTFFDECYLLRLTEAADDYGQLIATWTPETTATTCGFRATGRTQRIGAVVATTEVDAILRVPMDTTIGLADRVRLTMRHGSAVAAEDFDVFGVPRRGPSCLVVDLRRVEL